MGRSLRHLCVLAFMFVLACGGLRGEAEHMQPQAATVALSARMPVPNAAGLTPRGESVLAADKPVRRVAATAAAAVVAAPTPQQASHELPHEPRLDAERSREREFPLYGVAFHVQAQVFAEPSDKAEVTGYFRRGGQLRAKAGVRGKGCNTQWHELEGGGFACAGRGFMFGSAPQVFAEATAPATVHEDLPYAYSKTLQADAPQYYQLPSRSEETASQAALRASAAQHPVAKPAALSADAAKQANEQAAEALPANVRMLMRPGFYLSVDSQQESEGRSFARTVRGAYVRADGLTPVSISALHGTQLPAGAQLPLGLVYRAGLTRMHRNPMSGALEPAGSLALMQPFALTDEVVSEGGRRYLVARDGSVVPEDALRVIEHADRPPFVPPRTRWISIQLSTQTLVAYDGKTPVFATLVSTGKEEHPTPTGIFRIQSKHVSTTMDGEAGTDEAYSIEDVPWTMYFSGGVALHAAFWHQRFGRVRSHGCVNLAPADAHWLFDWTTPNLPSGFHGVNATKDNLGTFVVITP